tara:strand:- start:8 stop:436 length:429 start_codon:yes stop_codon:yes gene_type:complete
MAKPIDSFSGEYRFLSNFWMTPLSIGPLTFASAEHAYQAAKGLDQTEWLKIIQCSTPGQAKRAGQKINMRSDWDQVKLELMREIIEAKFTNTNLRKMLVETGDLELIEGNNWGDTYWGICRGRGQNNLGKLLMNERSKHTGD